MISPTAMPLSFTHLFAAVMLPAHPAHVAGGSTSQRACSSAGVKKTSAGVSITEVYVTTEGETDILIICIDLIKDKNNLVRFF